MKDAVLGTNLLAGGVAAGLLVVLVFALGVPLWLAVLLALAAFVGLVLLRSGRSLAGEMVDRAELLETLRRGANEVAEMRRLANRVPLPAAKVRALAICDSADRILAALQEDGRGPQTAQAFRARCLVPSRTLLTRYVRLAGRGVASAEPELTKIEDRDLPRLDRKLRQLCEGIHRGDAVDLEVAGETLEIDLAGGQPVPSRGSDG